MGVHRSATVLRHLRALYEAGAGAGLTDEQLLERFNSRRAGAGETNVAAEAAFAALMARHGPMVLGVCRRALSDPNDVEDAFQATFLVLVRRAATIRVHDTLGRWLYGVARRVAARARAAARRRQARVAPIPGDLVAPPQGAVDQVEWTAILDEELARLPEKYRLPLVLCYLVGLSNEEAAQRLGCPIGTVQSRLSRGRERLRARLRRRGLSSVVAPMATLTEGGARPTVPAALENSTIRAVMRLTAGRGATTEVVSTSVAALAEGVARIMIWNQVRTAAALLFLLGATAITAVGVLAQSTAHSPPSRATVPTGARQDPSRPSPRMKTLTLPADRSLGVIYTRRPGTYKDAWGLAEDPWAGWEKVAVATGSVEVPVGQEVRLDVRTAACNDLSPLRRLNPDELSALDFRGAAIPENGIVAISHLTGLRALRFSSCRIDNAGMKPLSRLSSLRTLSFLGTPVGDDGLISLAPLPSLTDLDLANTRATGRSVTILAKMAALRRLDISGLGIGDAGLARLAKLQEMAGLEHLRICSDPYLTDAGLEQVANLKHLKTLDLTGTSVGDVGLAHLGRLKELEFLRLTDTKVTDAGLAHLKNLTALKILLPPAGITDKGLAQIGQLPSLRYLWITYSPITNAGLAHLAGLKNLETLVLDCAEARGVTDEGVPEILKLSRLKELGLYATGISDAGLAKLATLKALETLRLGGNRITWDGLRHLGALPALKELGLAAIRGDTPGLRHLRPLRSLKRLSLNGNGRLQSDADLADLEGLAGLERLTIDGIPITDEGMRHLAGLTGLRYLYLSAPGRIKVGDAGLAALKKLRNLEYLWISGPITDHGLKQLEHLESLRFLGLGSRTISDGAIAELKQKLPLLQEVRNMPPPRPIGNPPAIGAVAPDFEVKTFGGETLRLRDLRGRTVLLHFWATWSNPCMVATPDIKTMQEELGRQNERFLMISLSLDEDDRRARRHAERHQLRWPQAWIGMDSPTQARYGVRDAPTYVVIGPDGRVAARPRSLEEVRAAVIEAAEAEEP